MDWVEALTTGTTAAGAFVTMQGAIRTVHRWWRAGPGSRRTWEGQLNQLACGITLPHAVDLLGPALLQRSLPIRHPWDDLTDGKVDGKVVQDHGRRPGRSWTPSWWRSWWQRCGPMPQDQTHPADRAPGGATRQMLEQRSSPTQALPGQHGEQGLREWVHRTPHAWVQLLSSDDVVVRVAITVSDPKFTPRVAQLTHGMLDLRLGRDTFAASSQQPQGAHPWIGARRAGYKEWFWFGNPGNYQHYALAWNDASRAGGLDIEAVRAAERVDLADADLWGQASSAEPGTRAHSELRQLCRPNTVVLSAPLTNEELLLTEPIGVDLDHIRVLPTAFPAAASHRRRAAFRVKR